MTSQLLTFTPNVNRNVVNVTINNDDIVEGPEEFFGNLMEVPGLVRTDPSIARVEITEDPNDRKRKKERERERERKKEREKECVLGSVCVIFASDNEWKQCPKAIYN